MRVGVALTERLIVPEGEVVDVTVPELLTERVCDDVTVADQE